LIQILRINVASPVNSAVAVAEIRRVNPIVAAAKRAKAVSGNADTAFRLQKTGNRRARNFTAR